MIDLRENAAFAMAATGIMKNDVNFPGLRVHLANIARFMRTLLHELIAIQQERVPCHVDNNVSLLCSISYAATFIHN